MNSVLVLGLFLFLWPFSSGKTYHMTASRSVPAASGTVSVHKSNPNRNTELDIKVSNLARPSSLVPPETVYVVWVRPGDGAAVNEGALRVDNNLDGQLKAVTTLKNCDVFITAEQSATITAPAGPEVLRTHISLD